LKGIFSLSPSALAVRSVLEWLREKDYPVLLEILDDADKMPRTWKEWLKRAEQMEERAKAQGYRTQRVYIDPDRFADWCLCEGMSTDSEGRQKFALARYCRSKIRGKS
jgi:hypothetical protein